MTENNNTHQVASSARPICQREEAGDKLNDDTSIAMFYKT